MSLFLRFLFLLGAPLLGGPPFSLGAPVAVPFSSLKSLTEGGPSARRGSFKTLQSDNSLEGAPPAPGAGAPPESRDMGAPSSGVSFLGAPPRRLEAIAPSGERRSFSRNGYTGVKYLDIKNGLEGPPTGFEPQQYPLQGGPEGRGAPEKGAPTAQQKGFMLRAFHLLVKLLAFITVITACSVVAQGAYASFAPNETVLMLGKQLLNGNPRTIHFMYRGLSLESSIVLYPYPPENVTQEEFAELLMDINSKLNAYVDMNPSERARMATTVFGPRGSLDRVTIKERRW